MNARPPSPSLNTYPAPAGPKGKYDHGRERRTLDGLRGERTEWHTHRNQLARLSEVPLVGLDGKKHILLGLQDAGEPPVCTRPFELHMAQDNASLFLCPGWVYGTNADNQYHPFMPTLKDWPGVALNEMDPDHVPALTVDETNVWLEVTPLCGDETCSDSLRIDKVEVVISTDAFPADDLPDVDDNPTKVKILRWATIAVADSLGYRGITYYLEDHYCFNLFGCAIPCGDPEEKTAIVPVDFGNGIEHVGFACVERPEAWFEDTIEDTDPLVIPPDFLAAVVPGSIRTAWRYGGLVRIEGTPRHVPQVRFARATAQTAKRNEEFWKQAHQP